MATKEDDWFSLKQCAAAFGVTLQAFHKTYRPLIPADAIRGKGERGVKVRCRALIDAWVNHNLDKQRAVSGSDEDALVYAGSDSPNLERLRSAKAQLAEMDLEERRKTHANLKELHSSLMRFGGQIRRGGEVLQRKYGPEAADVLNEAIDQALHEWKRTYGADDAQGVDAGDRTGR